jgi:hypothetical protein
MGFGAPDRLWQVKNDGFATVQMIRHDFTLVAPTNNRE